MATKIVERNFFGKVKQVSEISTDPGKKCDLATKLVDVGLAIRGRRLVRLEVDVNDCDNDMLAGGAGTVISERAREAVGVWSAKGNPSVVLKRGELHSVKGLFRSVDVSRS